MKTYLTSGTAGDAFTTLCKLWDWNYRPIHCIHTVTEPQYWEPIIRQIYSVKPNLTVNLAPASHHERLRFQYPLIDSHPPGGEVYRDPPEIRMAWFPEIHFADIKKFDLPEKYGVVVPVGGGRKGGKSSYRELRSKDIREMSERSEGLPLVVLGNEWHTNHDESLQGLGMIDLVRQTNVLEAQEIVKNAYAFWGMQGLLCFTALSQKVTTYAFCLKEHEQKVLNHRLIGEWANYLSSLRTIP